MEQNKEPELRMKYEFNAPKETVFKAFSTAEAMGEWWGPAECKNSVLKLDFKPGGQFHFKMEMGGNTNYGLFIFSRIQPYDLLEFTNSFADENGNIVKAPFDIELPLKILYTLVFTESNGKTTITMTGLGMEATETERQAFRSINENVQEGFGATFRKLEDYLGRK